MEIVYATVVTKRAAADEAMERARQRVLEVSEFAVQADEIAPLATEEENQ